MRVLLVCCEKEPRIVNVPHELTELQRLVGGMIEVVEPFDDGVALVCDENGRSDGKPVNRKICQRQRSSSMHPCFGYLILTKIRMTQRSPNYGIRYYIDKSASESERYR